jgi:hypothetical protein
MIRGIVFGATLLTVLPASAADLSQQVADAIASWMPWQHLTGLRVYDGRVRASGPRYRGPS